MAKAKNTKGVTPRRVISDEMKRRAVAMVNDGKPIMKVVEKFGFSTDSMLYSWLKDSRYNPSAPGPAWSRGSSPLPQTPVVKRGRGRPVGSTKPISRDWKFCPHCGEKF